MRVPAGHRQPGPRLLSAILYGTRLSLASARLGAAGDGARRARSGLVAGYVGGTVDACIMRIADVQLSFPAILIALLIDGVARARCRASTTTTSRMLVLILAIGAVELGALRAHGARLDDGREEQGIRAGRARDRHRGRSRSCVAHVLPNVLGPVLVIATINIATAIITEATLSFLGVGVPPTAAFARHADPRRQRLSVLRRMVDHGVSRRRAGHPGRSRSTCSATGCATRSIRSCGDSKLRDAGDRPLLEVATCASNSRRGAARCARSTTSRFAIAPGEVLGVVGESGAGKSLTGAAIIGLLEPPGRIAGGEIRLDGRRIDNLPHEAMRRCAAARIGAIFQDPLTSLNPLYTDRRASSSRPSAPTCRSAAAQARARALALLQRGRHPGAGAAHRPLSAPVLRRHAPARRDRAGARGRAAPDHRRRADHGARRLDPGADHRAAQAAVPRARHRGAC